MEAGRVDPARSRHARRTTLIASTHRSFAVVEKGEARRRHRRSRCGDRGRGGVAAKRTIAFDMEALAAKHGSVISAGSVRRARGAGALPFGRDAFEAVDPSRRHGASSRACNAFAAGYRARARKPQTAPSGARRSSASIRCRKRPAHPALDTLVEPHPRVPGAAAPDALRRRQAPRRFPGPRLCRRISRPASPKSTRSTARRAAPQGLLR